MFSLSPMAADPPCPATEPDLETDAEARARHLRTLRRMAELGMEMAERAAAQGTLPQTASAKAATPNAATPNAATPNAATPNVAIPNVAIPDARNSEARDANLAFARVTRAVRQAMALETRIRSGEPLFRAKPDRYARPITPDPRRIPLRQALYKATEVEPDRATRTQMRRGVDERIEEELLLDPEYTRALAAPLRAIATEFGLNIELSDLPDEFLTRRSAPRPPPSSGPEPPNINR